MEHYDEDGEIIPKEFLGLEERWGLGYQHTPSGVALILGGFAVYIGLLLAFLPGDASDRGIGIALIVAGLPLLVLSRIAYTWQRRRQDERRLRYLEWKRRKAE